MPQIIIDEADWNSALDAIKQAFKDNGLEVIDSKKLDRDIIEALSSWTEE